MMRSPDATTVIRARQGAAVWRRLDDETILLAVDQAVYLKLNETATELWAGIVTGATRSGLISRLVTCFEVDEETAAHDVDTFVEQCRARGLLAT